MGNNKMDTKIKIGGLTMLVLTPEQKSKINKHMEEVNKRIRRQNAMAFKKAQEIYINR